jgi:hypothetical protein
MDLLLVPRLVFGITVVIVSLVLILLKEKS